MKLQSKLREQNRKRKLRYCLKRLKSAKNFVPGKEYNIVTREKHRVPNSHPEYETDPGEGLLLRNEHNKRVQGLPTLSLPSRFEQDYISEHQPALEDFNNWQEFENWFEEKYSGLEDGVYFAIQRQGRGKIQTNPA